MQYHNVCLIITVTDTENRERFFEYYKENEIYAVLTATCYGTARDSVLDMLGLEKTKKAIFFALARTEKIKKLFKGLESKLKIDLPGNGIAFTVPVSSIGGHSLKYLAGEDSNRIDEVKEMNETEYDLIIAVANKGYTEMVMEAARSANATGGTVISAKGSDHEEVEKFFGVSLTKEKEMMFIVSLKKNRAEIMKAIMAKAGTQSPAHTVVFSIPVEHSSGIHFSDDENDD